LFGFIKEKDLEAFKKMEKMYKDAEKEHLRLTQLADDKEMSLQDKELEEERKNKVLLLEKSWHALHFLLTEKIEGGNPPLANAILGGTNIGEDLGYGPARYLTPDEVKDVSKALLKISSEKLKTKFNVKKLQSNEIYPAVWEKNSIEWLLDFYEKMVSYYQEAAKNNQAMLLWIG
jgi:hypothetical protein